MTPEEYDRVKVLGYRGNRGLMFSPEESEFVNQLFKKYPKEYKKANEEGALKAIKEINPLRE